MQTLTLSSNGRNGQLLDSKLSMRLRAFRPARASQLRRRVHPFRTDRPHRNLAFALTRSGDELDPVKHTKRRRLRLGISPEAGRRSVNLKKLPRLPRGMLRRLCSRPARDFAARSARASAPAWQTARPRIPSRTPYSASFAVSP